MNTGFGEGGSRPTPSPRAVAAGGCLVAVLFGAPLFFGLDRRDLQSDEAIYAYAIDRMLETGDWLTPRSIRVDGPFLEKPPLKIWLAAGLIRTGIAQRDERGYRVLDALFGALAFLYIYAIGVRTSGVFGGIAAVLTVFALDTLLFEHGLRSNNMEAALFLAYAGGIYHFLAWVSTTPARARMHIAAASLYFVLGFMTKFVAVLFLPVVCLGGLTSQVVRERARRDWRKWCAAAVATTMAIVPWFAVETALYGSYFWSVILGEHILTRFTSSLDPSHLQPWYYYVTTTWSEFERADAQIAAALGIGTLLWLGFTGSYVWRVLMLWAVLPFVFISLGTSKLLHYVYPFWPPIGLAIAWLATRIWDFGAQGRAAAVARLRRSPIRSLERKELRVAFALAATAALAITIATAVHGRVTWEIGQVTVFRNSDVHRSALLSAIFLCLALPARLSSILGVSLILIFLLPVSGYPEQLARLGNRDQRISSIGECLRDSVPAERRLDILDTTNTFYDHSYYYYLYRLGDWIERPNASPEIVLAHLSGSPSGPALVNADTLARVKALGVGIAGVDIDGNIILLPTHLARCAHVSVEAGASRIS